MAEVFWCAKNCAGHPAISFDLDLILDIASVGREVEDSWHLFFEMPQLRFTQPENRMEVFHGSLTSDIQAFHVGAHFGNRKQALIAIAAHKFFDGFEGLPTIYHCQLDVTLELLALADWKSPKTQAAYYAYCKATGKENEFLEHLIQYRDHDDPETEFRALLLKAASMAGHLGASYQNDVEGAGLSWCIYQPESVRIHKVEVPKWQEVAQWFLTSTKHEDFGMGRHRWKEACDAAGKVL